MKKTFNYCVALVSVLFFSSCLKTDNKISSFIESQYSVDEAGAVITVSKNGEEILNKAIGLADIEKDISMEPKMIFPIASMTKAYTAVAIMQLQENNKLSIEDDILKYLDGFADEYKQVKIKHLLSNTSGILSYNRMPEYQTINNKDTLTLNSMVGLIKNKPLTFTPHERFSYSNSNYILLTKIIEIVSKHSYQDYIQTNILDKANLKHTYFEKLESNLKGYELVNDTIIENSEDTHHTFGAGMLYASSADVIKFLNALNSELLISKENTDYLYSIPLTHNDGRPDEYASGFWVTKFGQENIIKMEGYCAGFYTMAFYIPNQDIAVTVFPNSSGYSLPVNQSFVAEWIYRHLTNKKAEIYNTIKLNESNLKKFQAVYQIDSLNSRQVFVKDGVLYTLRTGGQTLKAKPYDEYRFFYPNTFTTFEFIKNNDVFEMVMNDDDSNLSTAVMTEQPLREEVKISKNTLKKYVGKYERGFNIYIENDDLMFTNGFHSYKLYASSNNEFFPFHEDSKFVFEEEGTMQLTYSIGNYTMLVKRIQE